MTTTNDKPDVPQWAIDAVRELAQNPVDIGGLISPFSEDRHEATTSLAHIIASYAPDVQAVTEWAKLCRGIKAALRESEEARAACSARIDALLCNVQAVTLERDAYAAKLARIESIATVGLAVIDELNLAQPTTDATKENTRDDLFDQAVEAVRLRGIAKVIDLQREFHINFFRANRLIEQMGDAGFLEERQGCQGRKWKNAKENIK